MPKSYSGCICRKPLFEHTYKNEPLNVEQHYELTYNEILQMMPNMNNLDIRVEHGNNIIGKIKKTYINDKGEWYAEFELDDSFLGKWTSKFIDSQLIDNLSLQHQKIENQEKSLIELKPIELSICWFGARPGTFIETNLTNCKSFETINNENLLKNQLSSDTNTHNNKSINTIMASVVTPIIPTSTDTIATMNTNNLNGNGEIQTHQQLPTTITNQSINDSEETIANLEQLSKEELLNLFAHKKILTKSEKAKIMDLLLTSEQEKQKAIEEQKTIQAKLKETEENLKVSNNDKEDIRNYVGKVFEDFLSLSPYITQEKKQLVRDEIASGKMNGIFNACGQDLIAASAFSTRFKQLDEKMIKNDNNKENLNSSIEMEYENELENRIKSLIQLYRQTPSVNSNNLINQNSSMLETTTKSVKASLPIASNPNYINTSTGLSRKRKTDSDGIINNESNIWKGNVNSTLLNTFNMCAQQNPSRNDIASLRTLPKSQALSATSMPLQLY